MSKKNVRRPADGARKEFKKKHAARFDQMQDRDAEAKPVDPDMEFLESLDPEKREAWVRAGQNVRDGFDHYFHAPSPPHSSNNMREMLENCTRFLGLLVQLAYGVLETVDKRAMRELVASELPLPREMRVALKAAGYDVDETVKTNPTEDGVDHRKLPRGRRHPLIVLIGFALQASRLLEKLVGGMNKQVYDRGSRGSGKTITIPDLPDIPGPC